MPKTNDNNDSALVFQPTFTVERQNLDEHNSAESLFAEAIRLGEADECDLRRFLKDVSLLLRRTIEAQSGGASTSVREETAQKYVSSILYVIGAALRQEPTPEAAVVRLMSELTEKIFDSGLLLLNDIKSRAKMLRDLIKNAKKPDQSDDYYTFIDIVAKRYIDSYEPKYNAAESVWVRVPELDMDENVKGMLDIYMFLCRLFEYNQG